MKAEFTKSAAMARATLGDRSWLRVSQQNVLGGCVVHLLRKSRLIVESINLCFAVIVEKPEMAYETSFFTGLDDARQRANEYFNDTVKRMNTPRRKVC